MTTSNKTCYYTYNGVSIFEGSMKASPCCQYITQDHDPQILTDAINEQDGFDAFLRIPQWRETRARLDSGEEAPGCRICFTQERSEIRSRRSWYNSTNNSRFQAEKLQTLELALDFTCNMMCRTCKPALSSKWAQADSLVEELARMYSNPRRNHYQSKVNPMYKDTINQLIHNTDFSDLLEINLVGGEPFYSKSFPMLVDKLSCDVKVEDLVFVTTSNGSIMPSEYVLEFFKKTKQTRINISIDAIGDLGECIRWGVAWHTIHDNIMKWKQIAQEHKNIKISIHPTISILNINKLQEIVDYCDGHDIEITFHELDAPRYLNHKQIPVEIRKQWLVSSEKQYGFEISNMNKIITGNSVEYNDLDIATRAFKLIDDYQQKQFKNFNPEIWNIMNELQKPKIFDLSNTEKYHNYINAPESWRHIFDELEILFNPEWKNIAINLSGGADSACLTSILATIIKEKGYDCKIHVLTHVRVWQTRPWAAPISVEVYNKLKEMWGNIIGERIVNFIPTELEDGVSGSDLLNGKSGDRIIVGAFNKYAKYTYNFDATFNATTLNPAAEDFDGPQDRNYIPDWENDHFEQFDPTTSVARRPFNFVEKDFVIATYIRHGWDDLLATTRSCEGDAGLHPEMFVDYTEYKHGETDLPLCGVCFWCKEREWATQHAKLKLGMK